MGKAWRMLAQMKYVQPLNYIFAEMQFDPHMSRPTESDAQNMITERLDRDTSTMGQKVRDLFRDDSTFRALAISHCQLLFAH